MTLIDRCLDGAAMPDGCTSDFDEGVGAISSTVVDYGLSTDFARGPRSDKRTKKCAQSQFI